MAFIFNIWPISVPSLNFQSHFPTIKSLCGIHSFFLAHQGVLFSPGSFPVDTFAGCTPSTPGLRGGRPGRSSSGVGCPGAAGGQAGVSLGQKCPGHHSPQPLSWTAVGGGPTGQLEMAAGGKRLAGWLASPPPPDSRRPAKFCDKDGDNTHHHMPKVRCWDTMSCTLPPRLKWHSQ